jgi:hypothetical protein
MLPKTSQLIQGEGGSINKKSKMLSGNESSRFVVWKYLIFYCTLPRKIPLPMGVPPQLVRGMTFGASHH